MRAYQGVKNVSFSGPDDLLTRSSLSISSSWRVVRDLENSKGRRIFSKLGAKNSK